MDCIRSRHGGNDDEGGGGGVVSLLSSLAERVSSRSNSSQATAYNTAARNLIGAMDIDELTKHFDRMSGGDREMDHDVKFVAVRMQNLESCFLTLRVDDGSDIRCMCCASTSPLRTEHTRLVCQ